MRRLPTTALLATAVLAGLALPSPAVADPVDPAATADAAATAAPAVPTRASVAAGYSATLGRSAVVTVDLLVPTIDCTVAARPNGVVATVRIGDSLLLLLSNTCSGGAQDSVLVLTAGPDLVVRAGDVLRARLDTGPQRTTVVQVQDLRTGEARRATGDPQAARALTLGVSALANSVPFRGARFNGVRAGGVALADLPGLVRTYAASTDPIGSSHVVVTARASALVRGTDFSVVDVPR